MIRGGGGGFLAGSGIMAPGMVLVSSVATSIDAIYMPRPFLELEITNSLNA